MTCKVIQQNNYVCGRLTYQNEERCHIHIRKWIQIRLEALGIIKKYPRKIDEIKSGLNLIRSTDPNYKDKYGYNIIHEGALRSDINLIQQGIKIGVDINGRSYNEEHTPLHLVNSTKANILLILLKAGADVKAKDIHGHTKITIDKKSHAFHKSAVRAFKDDIKKNCNLMSIVNVWNTVECANWRESIISRFVNRLPNISNRGALFDVFYDYFELSHILCIQNA